MMPKYDQISNADAEELLKHMGHDIVIVTYGDFAPWCDVAIECKTCGQVLIDWERSDMHDDDEDPQKPDEVNVRQIIQELESRGIRVGKGGSRVFYTLYRWALRSRGPKPLAKKKRKTVSGYVEYRVYPKSIIEQLVTALKED